MTPSSPISGRAGHVHDLLTLEGKLFVESCEVKNLEGEEAQQVVAACLLEKELSLEVME